MSFHITHRYGTDERDPPLSKLPELLRELEDRAEDTEHTSVSLTHDSEWNLGAYRGGFVIFENLESDADTSRHMRDVPKAKIVEMWTQLSQGQIDVVAAEAWIAGYPK